MAWVAKLGSTLLIPSGGCDHLHIVCCDPLNFPGRASNSCLLVNVSTTVPKCDRTVVLNLGDHPFINHESFVFYKKAFTETASALQLHVATGFYKAHLPVDRSLVKRVIACMDTSDFTSGEMLSASKQVWTETTW